MGMFHGLIVSCTFKSKSTKGRQTRLCLPFVLLLFVILWLKLNQSETTVALVLTVVSVIMIRVKVIRCLNPSIWRGAEIWFLWQAETQLAYTITQVWLANLNMDEHFILAAFCCYSFVYIWAMFGLVGLPWHDSIPQSRDSHPFK